MREAASLLQGQTVITSWDYTAVLAACTPDDFVYLDPPYQGVWGNRPSSLHLIAGAYGELYIVIYGIVTLHKGIAGDTTVIAMRLDRLSHIYFGNYIL